MSRPGNTGRGFVELLVSSVAAGIGLIGAVVILSAVFHTQNADTSSVVSFFMIAVAIACGVAGWRWSKRLLPAS